MSQAISKETTPATTRNNARFSPLQRALHWTMAVCILAMLFIGVGMVSTVRPDYLTLVSIHKPLGIVILALGLIRLAARIMRGAPPLPADMPQPMKLAAHLSHLAFYALMIALPLLGYGMLSAADYPVIVFGVHLPSLLPHSDALHTLLWNAHRFLALCFFALIVVHLAAALFHALVRRDGVFHAMAPWRWRIAASFTTLFPVPPRYALSRLSTLHSVHRPQMGHESRTCPRSGPNPNCEKPSNSKTICPSLTGKTLIETGKRPAYSLAN